MSDLEKSNELAGLVEQLLAKLDEEAEHGEYHAANMIPDRYRDDKPNYYDRHHAIINEVCTLRDKVEKCIREIRGVAA